MIEELIRANKRKSLYLLILSMVIMLIVGYVLGDLLFSQFNSPRIINYEQKRMYFAFGFSAFIGFIEFIQIYFIFNGKPKTLFKQLGLKPAAQTKFRKLNNVIAEMSIAAGLSKPPQAYVIPSKAINAMAFGTKPEHSAICVTAGLLSVCNRDELQGVVAHELSHILNQDILLLEVCRSTLGMVIVLREVMLRSMYWGSLGRANYRSSSSKSRSSNLHLVFIIIGVIFAIIAPLLVQLIYFALSRQREYLADAYSAKLTRYPAGLASALTKIAYSSHSIDKIDKVTSAAFIDQPFGNVVITSKGTRTHPPIWNRIKILQQMSGGAGYIDYKKAYQKVTQSAPGFMPSSMANSRISFPIRAAMPLADEPGAINSPQELRHLEKNLRSDDVIRISEGYGFVNCECGMNIKIPPEYKKFQVKCPRCGRIHILEDKMQATLSNLLDDNNSSEALISPVTESVKKEKEKPDYSAEERQVYKKTGKGWEKIKCRCGNEVELSPTFVGRFISCRKCGRKINIKS